MTPNVTIAKWTVEQYHQMIAAGILDDQRVELLNGEIIEAIPAFMEILRLDVGFIPLVSLQPGKYERLSTDTLC